MWLRHSRKLVIFESLPTIMRWLSVSIRCRSSSLYATYQRERRVLPCRFYNRINLIIFIIIINMDSMDAQIARYQEEKAKKEKYINETLEYNQYDRTHFEQYMEYKKGKCD